MAYYMDFELYENITELVMNYNGLADPFTMNVPLGIANTYSATLYFKAELITPPAGYSNYVDQLGSIAAGASDFFLFNFDRAIPAAKTTDALTVRVTAYTDAYITELCHYDLAVNFYLYDQDDLTLVDHATFDDGTAQGWSLNSVGEGIVGIASDYFYSAPYSIKSSKKYPSTTGIYDPYISKTLTIGAVSEAFLSFHMRANSGTAFGKIKVDGEIVQPIVVMQEFAINQWHRVAFKIPVNKDVAIEIYLRINTDYSTWVDEIFVGTI